jgi:hypothetical protein
MNFFSIAWDAFLIVMTVLATLTVLSCFWVGVMFIYEAHEWLIKRVIKYWEDRK